MYEIKIGDKIYYSEGAVAEMLDVKTTTLRQWRTNKTGPHYIKYAKGILYSADDLNAWLESNTVHTDDGGGETG